MFHSSIDAAPQFPSKLETGNLNALHSSMSSHLFQIWLDWSHRPTFIWTRIANPNSVVFYSVVFVQRNCLLAALSLRWRTWSRQILPVLALSSIHELNATSWLILLVLHSNLRGFYSPPSFTKSPIRSFCVYLLFFCCCCFFFQNLDIPGLSLSQQEYYPYVFYQIKLDLLER